MQPKKDRIRFGAFSPVVLPALSLPLERQVRFLADAGIDFVIAGWYDGFTSFDEKARGEFFRLFEKYGIECIFYDEEIMFGYQGDRNAMMFDAAKLARADRYKDSPAFGGNSFIDEPGNVHFAELGRTVKEYQRLFPGKLPFVNLLPMYANAKQLSGGQFADAIDYYDAQDVSYQNYLDEYVEKVPTDYICVDIYPCHARDGRKTTYKDYVRSIEIVADTCRREGRAFWCCIQSCSWDPSIRVPDEADFRWQVYTLLSYGVTNLIDYLFGNRMDTHKGTPIAKDGSKTPTWLANRRVAFEVRAISDVYMRYANLGAFSVNCTEYTPYLRMAHPYRDFAAIREIRCDAPLLIGCFAKKDGVGSAFTIVNMTDLSAQAPVGVRMKIDGAPVSYFHGWTRAEIACEDGFYEFTLEPGGGVFVTVD